MTSSVSEHLRLSDYEYDLPDDLIAQVPATDRDRSRLLVLDRRTGAVAHRVFSDIVEYLVPGDLLIVNDTKVFPCRLAQGSVAERGHREPGQSAQRCCVGDDLSAASQARLEEDGEAEGLVDPASLPMQALVLAYGEERDAALLKVFCRSEARRALLIRYLGRGADELDEGFIARMIATPELTAEERDLIGMALSELHGRLVENSRPFGARQNRHDSNAEWYVLLNKLLKGETPDAKPIRCPARDPAQID